MITKLLLAAGSVVTYNAEIAVYKKRKQEYSAEEQ